MNFSVPGFQLVDSAGNPVLTGNREALLLYNGGTVCYNIDTVFTHTSAHAICKLMGFQGATMAGFTRLFFLEKAIRQNLLMLNVLLNCGLAAVTRQM